MTLSGLPQDIHMEFFQQLLHSYQLLQRLPQWQWVIDSGG
jgi:hypothetical protein